MRLPAAVKRAVRKYARNRCEYCHSQEAFSPCAFSIEHIIPRSEGGGDEEANLALSCAAGKLNALAEEALADYHAGKSREI